MFYRNMAPSATKANYKTYEAQARLVRAIVAAHPGTKWNYKGNTSTAFALLSSYICMNQLFVCADRVWNEELDG